MRPSLMLANLYRGYAMSRYRLGLPGDAAAQQIAVVSRCPSDGTVDRAWAHTAFVLTRCFACIAPHR